MMSAELEKLRMKIVNEKRSEEPLIRLYGVVKKYKTAAGDLTALKGIDTSIYPGEFVGIMGKSGAGKTTLVNVLSGLDRLTEGEIWVGDVPVHTLNEDQAAAWRGRNLGVVYQTFQLMPTLSVMKNIFPRIGCPCYRWFITGKESNIQTP